MFFIKLLRHLGLIGRKKYESILLHHRVRKSKLFDEKWYLSKYPDVAAAGADPITHYVQYGWREGRNPSPKFNGDAYLADNPDVATAKVCPLMHYIDSGWREGRYVRAVSGIAGTTPDAITHNSLGERIVYAFQYPIRVRDEYERLRTEIRAMKQK